MHDILLTAQHSQPTNAFDCALDFAIPSRNQVIWWRNSEDWDEKF